MQKIAVCKDCADRYLGCHDHCEKYKDAKDKIQEQKDTIWNNMKKDMEYASYRRKKYRSKGQT